MTRSKDKSPHTDRAAQRFAFERRPPLNQEKTHVPIFPLNAKKMLTLVLTGAAIAAPQVQAQTIERRPTPAVGHASPAAQTAVQRLSDPDFDRVVPPAGIIKVLTKKDPKELLKLGWLLAKQEKAVGHPHRKLSKEKVLRLAMARAKATNDTATIAAIHTLAKATAFKPVGTPTPKLTANSRAIIPGRLTSPTRDDDEPTGVMPEDGPSDMPVPFPDFPGNDSPQPSSPTEHMPDLPDLPGGDLPFPLPDMPDSPGGDLPFPLPDLPDVPGGDLPFPLPDMPDVPGGDQPMPFPDGPGLPGGETWPFGDPTGPLFGETTSGAGTEAGGTGFLDALGAAAGEAASGATEAATTAARSLTGASRDFDPATIGKGRSPKRPETKLSAVLDPAFDTIVTPRALAAAWKHRDASALTDAGLMMAEGERVLKRSRKGLSASELLLAAARIAGQQHDRNTLDRLAGYARERGDSALAQQVQQARKMSAASPSKHPSRLAATSRAVPTAGTTMPVADVQNIVDGLHTLDVVVHPNQNDARRGHPVIR